MSRVYAKYSRENISCLFRRSPLYESNVSFIMKMETLASITSLMPMETAITERGGFNSFKVHKMYDEDINSHLSYRRA